VRIHFCGVRGSTPAPGRDFLRYGGHTSCVAIARDQAAVPTLILDAGTGVRNVTPLLDGKAFRGTILLTHLHWDHVQGLPFFQGGDRDDARVTLLLPGQADEASAEQVLSRAMSPPHFPIQPGDLRGAWTFGTIEPGHQVAEGFSVEVREIPHKGGRTLGYRVSDGRSVVAYVTDHCPTAFGPGPDGWGEYHASALDLAAGADVLIHDAHLLASEVAAEASFGHAAADYAVGLAAAAGARQVVLTHHKPDRTDAALDELGRRFAQAPVDVMVAAEGGILDL
jgi:phosphoribosyl 1,2-cyclic phosphodiesterase